MKPTLYLQSVPNSNKQVLMFEMCYSGLMGAHILGVEYKIFESIDEIPTDPTNIVVGSVEVSIDWLKKCGIEVPTPIDINIFKDFTGRECTVEHIKNVDTFPIFIKPIEQVKAFTGFVAYNPSYVHIFSEGYDGLVSVQSVVDIVSEYRLYVTNNKMIGLKQYSGDFFVFPDTAVISDCFTHAKQILDLHSYTLDFGVTQDGRTILIECNDAWSVGNYGLDVCDYYYFIRNRWLQITGIRKRMD